MIAASAIIGPNGTVYLGRRHADVIRAMVLEEGFVAVHGEQGFVTHNGEFMNRQQAARHALSCGQITELKFQPDTLFSEDLW